MKSQYITIAGMILTILLSLGGSWVGNLITNAEQGVSIAKLEVQANKSDLANVLTYRLENEVIHNQMLMQKQQKEIDTAKRQVAEAEVNAARREANQINLIKSTDRLINTVEKLIVKVDSKYK